MAYTILEEVDKFGVQFNQDGMTATRKCNVTGSYLDFAEFMMGVKFTTAGMSGNRFNAQQWPGISALRVDNISIEPAGKTTGTWTFNDSESQAWSNIWATINYTTIQEEEEGDEPDDETAYMQTLSYSVQVAIVPFKVEDTHSTSTDGGATSTIQTTTKTVKRHIRLPQVAYGIKWPRVTPATFRVINGNILKTIGKVNEGAMFGAKAEEVLFDGPSANREVTILGKRAWSLDLQFIYNPRGWNNTLHPRTLKWVPAKALLGDNAPYEKADLDKLLPTIGI